MRHHGAEPMMSSLTLAHARIRPSCVMMTFAVATSLEPASKSAPVHFEGHPASKFHRATSSILEFFATIEPLRRAASMSPSMTCLRHSHSDFDSSMRRSSVMSDHFIAPGTLRMIILPSFVASLYSMVSVSDSIPEHLRKLPISTLSISSTKMKLGVRSGIGYSSSLGGGRAALPLADSEDDELGRLDRGHADVHHELALVDRARWVVGLVAEDEERLVRRCPHERALHPQAAQERGDGTADARPQVGVVGLEDHPLGALPDRLLDGDEQPPHVDVPPALVLPRHGARAPDPGPVGCERAAAVDLLGVQQRLLAGRDVLLQAGHAAHDLVGRRLPHAAHGVGTGPDARDVAARRDDEEPLAIR